MVRGLDKFKKHFSAFKNEYILIGGSACDLLMGEYNLPFRRTKDLDIVLCVEALSEKFVEHFWDFIIEGNYSIMEKGNGDKCFYRFTRPQNEGYPFMLEILSREFDISRNRLPGTIAPLSVNDELVSLSAILLDDTYYNFIKSLKTEINGVILADEKCIIALKAKAWLDLTERRSKKDTRVKGSDIKKHKNDVYRLSQLLVEEPLENVPKRISEDIKKFTVEARKDNIDLKQISIESEITEICDLLLMVYCS